MASSLGLNYPRVFLALIILFVSSAAAQAQDIYTRFELGAQFSTIQQAPPGGGSKSYPGFGGRFDWNLNRRLAVESQIDFFPEHAAPLLYRQGGQSLQAVFGIRAKVVQTRRFAVFGLVRPGVLHFSDALFFNGDPTTLYGSKPVNYFVLNLGGGFEYYMTHRWALRADIEGNPYRVPNATIPGGQGSPSGTVQGRIGDTTRLSFGVAYRPGGWIENEPERAVSGRWEVGPVFSTMIITREGATEGTRTDPGFGGYASYKLYRVFYLDGDLLYYPRSTSSSGPHDGGEILQGLFGVKGGIRRNHFGFFGKVRPGFNSYSQALAGITQTPSSLTYSYDRATNFVIDLGGIIEFYPAERSTLRLEVGDTHVLFGTRNVSVNGINLPAPGGDLRHTMQFAFGYGWRF